MAMHLNEEQTEQHQQVNPLILDSLYCEEGKWEEEDEEQDDGDEEDSSNDGKNSSYFFPGVLLEQDLFWEDSELLTLFSKEREQKQTIGSTDPTLSKSRREAVEWMLKVNAHYGFSPLTAILAINYLDRFLCSFRFQKDKPWMIQLVSVTCISLAAKVEEIHVPLLLDLQVEDTRYIFEAKTIQRMELLVLSALQWKMHPVTPLSFIDHIIRQLGLKTHLHFHFLKRSESLLLSLISDTRFIGYLPSVLATATMMRVVDQIETCNPMEYQDQLLSVLKISKEEIKDCYDLILEASSSSSCSSKKSNVVRTHNMINPVLKRKYEHEEFSSSSSPIGVYDAVFSSDSSNDSWDAVGPSSSVVYSSPDPPFKKIRPGEDQPMKLPSALRRVFVGIVGSPP